MYSILCFVSGTLLSSGTWDKDIWCRSFTHLASNVANVTKVKDTRQSSSFTLQTARLIGKECETYQHNFLTRHGRPATEAAGVPSASTTHPEAVGHWLWQEYQELGRFTEQIVSKQASWWCGRGRRSAWRMWASPAARTGRRWLMWFQILDPSINTLPYLYTLLAHIEHGQTANQTPAATLKAFPPMGHLWGKMLDFMEHFDPVQVRYVGYEWRRLIDAVSRVADASSDVSSAT